MLSNTQNIPKTLFIEGVYLSDCKDSGDILQDKVIDELNDAASKNAPKKYIKLPNIYTKETWPTTSNLLCLTCGLEPWGTPIFIPKSIEPSAEGVTMTTHGIFCGFPCAKSYLKKKYKDVDIHKYSENCAKLRYLYKEMTGEDIDEIPETYDIEDMERHGGNLSDKEYKNKVRKLISSNISKKNYIFQGNDEDEESIMESLEEL